MASLPSGIAQSPDDEEKKPQDGQPLLSGGGASTAPASTGTPKSTGSTPGMGVDQGSAPRSAMQSQGSGFVNLQSYLTPTVAAQNQGQIKGMGADLTGKVQGAFNTQDQADTADIKKNTPKTANFGEISNMIDSGDTKGLGGVLDQHFVGPAGSTFDLGKNADNTRLGQLGNQSSAFDALHPELKGQDGLLAPTYSQGNNWLDQSLIQGDAGSLGEIGKTKSGYDDLSKFIGGQQADTGKLATSTTSAIDKARNDALGTAKEVASVKLAQATQDAKSANAERDALLNRYASQDPNSSLRMSGLNDPGKTATAGDFITGSQASGLSALAGYLKDPSLAVKSNGPYQAPTYQQEERPTDLKRPETNLDFSDNYSRNPTTGNWVNKSTGEEMSGMVYDDASGQFVNPMTGERKDAGSLFSGIGAENAAKISRLPGMDQPGVMGAISPVAAIAGAVLQPGYQDAWRKIYNPDGTLTKAAEADELKRRRATRKG